MTVVLSYVKQQAAGAFMRFKCITKEYGSTDYKSTRQRVSDGLLISSKTFQRNTAQEILKKKD